MAYPLAGIVLTARQVPAAITGFRPLTGIVLIERGNYYDEVIAPLWGLYSLMIMKKSKKSSFRPLTGIVRDTVTG